MKKIVRAVMVTMADTIRLDIKTGSEILGVGRGPNGITIYVLEPAMLECPSNLRHLRIVMGGVEFEAETAEKYIGPIAFGVSEVYHVWETTRPDRGRRESDLGLV